MADGDDFLQQLRRDGHVRAPEASLIPLTGGVSSEIYLVQDGERRFVVKRALAKLKVKDDWFADISRNASEREYIACVAEFVPGSVPQLLFANAQAGYFGMEFLGEGFANWKRVLLGGDVNAAHAQTAAEIMGAIHRATSNRSDLQQRFDTTANFHQLRTDPYLLTTGERHPDLRDTFRAEAERLEQTRECLVHGDFSPKNILIRDGRMVLLDCEVAWFGDPAFDVAFLLNHLFLKALYHAGGHAQFGTVIAECWRAYVKSSDRRDTDFETRVARLLPMLLLARVDGKSPVEYLTPPQQQAVRDFARPRIATPPNSVATLASNWLEHVARVAPSLHHS